MPNQGIRMGWRLNGRDTATFPAPYGSGVNLANRAKKRIAK